jgi:hypothetical protein
MTQGSFLGYVWLAGALNLGALIAAHALRRAGRSPARYVGFAWAMVLSGLVIGGWSFFLLIQALTLAVDTVRSSHFLTEGIAAVQRMSAVALIVPIGLLLATGVLAIVRRPRLPRATLVGG